MAVEEKNVPMIGLPITEKHSFHWPGSDGYSSASLFLPAAGYRYDSSLNNAGSWGNYWSRELCSHSVPYIAFNVSFNSEYNLYEESPRGVGYTVRAVRVPQN